MRPIRIAMRLVDLINGHRQCVQPDFYNRKQGQWLRKNGHLASLSAFLDRRLECLRGHSVCLSVSQSVSLSVCLSAICNDTNITQH